MALQAEEIDLNDDRLLVERYQAGDQTAFDVLYQRYFGRLRSYCQRRVGDPAEAEELAQEAFVRALTALPRFGGDRRFYPWMTVIAGRLCVDHHRRRGRVRPSDDVDPGTVDDDSHRRLDVQADLDNLDRALCRLGNRHREVLDLRERRGMTYAEIADRMEVPRTTVEALLFRARKALRREFLAVSGERLAALPAVAWVLHRATDLRLRLGAHLPTLGELTGPIAAGGVAAVIAISPVGGAAGGAEAHDSEGVTEAAPVVAVTPATEPAAVPVAPGAAPEADPAGTASDDGGSDSPSGSGTPSHRPAAASAAGVAVYNDASAKEQADGMPVSESLDDVSVGIDPQAAAGALSPTSGASG